MANFISKIPSSRINSPGVSYPWAGTGVSASTAVGSNTAQVRVITQLAGYITIGTTSDPTIASTAGAGTYIPVSVGDGTYFTVSGNQKIIFSSTTTSSASLWNLTEMS